jgi:ribose transport system ATP-binding protein
MPAAFVGDRGATWMREELDRVGCSVALTTRMDEVDVANRALIELAKALALKPAILILDEPTAAIGADMVRRVFDAVREAAARDAAVVSISPKAEQRPEGPLVLAVKDLAGDEFDGVDPEVRPAASVSPASGRASPCAR